jgi:hypothetical protein
MHRQERYGTEPNRIEPTESGRHGAPFRESIAVNPDAKAGLSMRAFQIFGAMSDDAAIAFFTRMHENSPAMFQQAVAAASAAMKARPAYLRKQPFEKRAIAVRRALSRVASNAAGEEMLAVYFLEYRDKLLIEWLEVAGVAHDEGTLAEDDPQEPAAPELEAAVKKFLDVDDDPDRDLLLRAFAAQSSIEWPHLDSILEASA